MACFLSVTSSGKFNISEIKDSSGTSGAEIGKALEQLDNTAKALINNVKGAKIGQIEISLPKGANLKGGYSVSGNQLIKVIDGKKVVRKVEGSVVKVNFY